MAYSPTARTKISELAAQSTSTLQDTFLKHLRDHSIEVTIFLANGIRPQGQIRSLAAFNVRLARGSSSQVVFKHATSAIYPAEPVRLMSSGAES